MLGVKRKEVNNMFTKEHYTAVAKVLHRNKLTVLYDSQVLFNKMVQDFVALFEKDNKKFDAEKFLDVIYGKEKK